MSTDSMCMKLKAERAEDNTHTVNLCCMRKSRGIGYGLSNKECIQQDA